MSKFLLCLLGLSVRAVEAQSRLEVLVTKPDLRCSNLLAGGMGRNLIPSEVPHLEEAHSYLPEPLKVSYGAVALPHPEKIADGGPKAVNKKSEGWGGEDAYFCTDER